MAIINKQDFTNAVEAGDAELLAQVIERDVEAAVENMQNEMQEAIANGYVDNTQDIAILDR